MRISSPHNTVFEESTIHSERKQNLTTNIMQSFSNLTAILNIIGITAVGQEFMQILTDIVIIASKERRVNTIIFTNHEQGNSTALDSMRLLRTLTQNTRGTITFLHIDSTPPIERYFNQFNNELLTIAKLKHNRMLDESLLRNLWHRLWRIRQTRLILLFDDLASKRYVAKILRMCLRYQVFNVIALQPHKAVVEGSYWTVRIFPTQMAVERSFTPRDYRAIFRNHLSNMYGHPLRIFTKAWYPQIYIYTPTNGNATLSGFLGRALVEYAKLHNATIEHPMTSQRKYLTYKELCDFFENKTIDMGSLQPVEFSNLNISYSVVFQRIDWCVMVPLEQSMPKSTFYYNIIQRTVLVVFSCSFLLICCFWICIARWQARPPRLVIKHYINTPLLFGLLGMAFYVEKRLSTMHKLICITISLVGVIVGTSYSTYLQSFIVNAPIGAKVQTIDELLDRGIPVAVSSEELELIGNNMDFRKYRQNFTVFSNFTELLLLRDTLDTRYAFTVTDMWAIYDELQKYFARPLFRLSNICFGRNYPMVIPLQESSMHRQPLNEFLALLHEAGLIDHWRRHSFLELLEMDWLSLYDKGSHNDFRPMRIDDLHKILLAMSGLLGLSLVCFVFELFVANFFRFYTSVRRIIRKILNWKK